MHIFKGKCSAIGIVLRENEYTMRNVPYRYQNSDGIEIWDISENAIEMLKVMIHICKIWAGNLKGHWSRKTSTDPSSSEYINVPSFRNYDRENSNVNLVH
ncbi:Hypothetical predicted protein [Octopus vulgaris]|uniref:Uncharacterized protein n=1 Tax=Octopus vulgaris TaxID=6645 RepID=A0AA36BDT4_OCTVU|nr:Hypothetical predicted protein [Octopus vulgaris]